MAERLTHQEHKQQGEIRQHREILPEHTKRGEHEAKAELKKSHQEVKELQKSAEAAALSGKEVSISEQQTEDQRPIIGLQRELKAEAYKRTITKVRSHLRPTEQLFSKFAHQPIVETLSDLGAKTVARPSGIFGGGITALLGSLGVLYMSKRYGFSYNFFVLIVLFATGFIVGMLAEVIVRTVHKKTKATP